jgi:hypothetical protein
MNMKMGSHHKEWPGSREGVEFLVDGWNEYREVDSFSDIRNEMGQFLLELFNSRQTASNEQRVHYLFLALKHLDNLEKEVRIHPESGNLAGRECILRRIRSLETLISAHIRKINIAGREAVSGFLKCE